MTACPLDYASCPALTRCGGTSNLCLLGRCGDCQDHPLLRMEVRRTVMRQLGGLDLIWPRPLRHHPVAELPAHLPVLIQAYADPVDLPWVALHAGRVLGVTGTRVTPKHRRPLREVYRLSPGTRLALEFYVEDRVLEGVWLHRRSVIPQLAELGFDLVLSPNVSVWRAESRLTVIWNRAAANRPLHAGLGLGHRPGRVSGAAETCLPAFGGTRSSWPRPSPLALAAVDRESYRFAWRALGAASGPRPEPPQPTTTPAPKASRARIDGSRYAHCWSSRCRGRGRPAERRQGDGRFLVPAGYRRRLVHHAATGQRHAPCDLLPEAEKELAP